MVNFLSFSDEFQKISAQSHHEAAGEATGRDIGGYAGSIGGLSGGAGGAALHNAHLDTVQKLIGPKIRVRKASILANALGGAVLGGAAGRALGGSIGKTVGNIKSVFTDKKGKTKKSEALYKAAEHFLRSGRRPISADRLLEKETEEQVTPSQVFEPAPKEEEKVSMDLGKAKTLATMGSGAALYHVVNKANEDRKLGRAVRLQQG